MSETENAGKKVPAFNIVIQRDGETKGQRLHVARMSLWENGSETVNAPQFTGSSDSPYGKLRVAVWKFEKKEGATSPSPSEKSDGEVLDSVVDKTVSVIGRYYGINAEPMKETIKGLMK